MLAEIVARVDGRAEVWVDGGVRRGLDIAIALALGARGVLVGRPIFWALAAGGQAGVERALAILREELEIALALLGAPTPADVTRAHVEPVRGAPVSSGRVTHRPPARRPPSSPRPRRSTADAAAARHAELAAVIDRANRLYHDEDAPELDRRRVRPAVPRARRARDGPSRS